MKRIVFLVLLIIIPIVLINAQDIDNGGFFKFNNLEKGREVYFYINGINSEVHKKKIYDELNNDANIFKFVIDNDNSCVALVSYDVDVDYIQEILTKNGAKLSFNKLNVTQGKYIPEDYPKKENYGSEEELWQAVKKWREENPQKWQDMLNKRYY